MPGGALVLLEKVRDGTKIQQTELVWHVAESESSVLRAIVSAMEEGMIQSCD